ncbi:hypothetical protein Glove_199g44 [Diversispora epigaea]|uniref:Small monomeric GTPase n=1 Tax=Diversispora epigaea TaxID=1348612 RepID=A0A397ITP6_9GLOM|nr:hypothetical protein Glove_199g44 [Diversispora epigaea]
MLFSLVLTTLVGVSASAILSAYEKYIEIKERKTQEINETSGRDLQQTETLEKRKTQEINETPGRDLQQTETLEKSNDKYDLENFKKCGIIHVQGCFLVTEADVENNTIKIVKANSRFKNYNTYLYLQTYDPTIEDSYRKQVVIDDQPCVLEVLDTAGQGTLQTYDPTIEDSYRKQVVIDDQPCVLEVLDTAGQEEYCALRDQWIRDGEGFLLVYSISSRSTFERVERFYDQILRVKDTESVPIMLVGNKCDKITEREVSREEGMNMAKRLKCEFIESSGKTCNQTWCHDCEKFICKVVPWHYNDSKEEAGVVERPIESFLGNAKQSGDSKH